MYINILQKIVKILFTSFSSNEMKSYNLFRIFSLFYFGFGLFLLFALPRTLYKSIDLVWRHMADSDVYKNNVASRGEKQMTTFFFLLFVALITYNFYVVFDFSFFFLATEDIFFFAKNVARAMCTHQWP